jgi:hypothetical protein
MVNGRVAVLAQRTERNEEDIRSTNGRVDELEKCHAAINVTLAKLPTREDLEKFANEIRECRVIDQKRVDILYTRDMWGTLIGLLLGAIGTIFGITNLPKQGG